MEFSFRPRNASGGPQLSALLSARDVEVFAQKEACVLILGNVSATPSGPVETLPACSREARLCSAKGEGGVVKIVPELETQPKCCHLRQAPSRTNRAPSTI